MLVSQTWHRSLLICFGLCLTFLDMFVAWLWCKGHGYRLVLWCVFVFQSKFVLNSGLYVPAALDQTGHDLRVVFACFCADFAILLRLTTPAEHSLGHFCSRNLQWEIVTTCTPGTFLNYLWIYEHAHELELPHDSWEPAQVVHVIGRWWKMRYSGQTRRWQTRQNGPTSIFRSEQNDWGSERLGGGADDRIRALGRRDGGWPANHFCDWHLNGNKMQYIHNFSIYPRWSI